MIERIVDWWWSRRDARLAGEALLPRARSRLAVIGQAGLGRIEQEWLRYRADIADPLTGLAAARAAHAATTKSLALAELELRDGSEPSEEQLTRRVGGEERTATGVIRNRRLADHRRRWSDATARTAELLAELTVAQTQIAQLTEAVQARFEVAQARASAIAAHVFQRRTAYLTHPIRHHPGIGQLLDAEFSERPPWTVAPRSPDLGEA